MRLENKNAIVTGAAKGMGAAITLTLAREGADLVLTARDTAALDEVAGEVRALGRRAQVVAADVTDEAQVAAMVEQAKNGLRRPHRHPGQCRRRHRPDRDPGLQDIAARGFFLRHRPPISAAPSCRSST